MCALDALLCRFDSRTIGSIGLICINFVNFLLARTPSVVIKVSVSIKIVLVRINAIISYLVGGGEYYRGGKKTNEYRTALL